VLTGLFVFETIAVIVNDANLSHHMKAFSAYESLPGCWVHITGNLYRSWIPLMIFEGIIMFLTLYKVFPFRTSTLTPIITLLARDSILYFVAIFSSMVMNVLDFKLITEFSLLFPTAFIACVTVSRMMMNLRGLIMEDPDHTVQLQTLHFASASTTDY